MIEVADFCDKREVLIGMGLLPAASKRLARAPFQDIERKLRNTVAHGATYVQNVDQLREFVGLLTLAEDLIAQLTALRVGL
jgi:hypothetical protein